jgi:CHAT domain-containing protein
MQRSKGLPVLLTSVLTAALSICVSAQPPSLDDAALEAQFEQRIDWGYQHDIDADYALRLVDYARNHAKQRRSRLLQALELVSNVYGQAGMFAEAEPFSEEKLQLLRQSDDRLARADALLSVLILKYALHKCQPCSRLAHELVDFDDAMLRFAIHTAATDIGDQFAHDLIGAAPPGLDLYTRVSGQIRPSFNIAAAVLAESGELDERFAAFAMSRKAVGLDLLTGQSSDPSSRPTAPLDRNTIARMSVYPPTAGSVQSLSPDPVVRLNRLRKIADHMTRFAYGSPLIIEGHPTWSSSHILQRERVALESSMTSPDKFLLSGPLLTAVRQAQPAGSVLIEYLVYDRPSFQGEGAALKNVPERRYLGILIRGQAPVVVRDLGAAADIDRLVVRVCESLLLSAPNASLARRCSAGVTSAQGASQGRSALLAELSARLLGPFREGIGQTSMVAIAPDAALNFLPFELLTDSSGHFLIERHVVTYLSSARDLVRAAQYTPSRTGPIIVGNPAYGSDLQDCDGTRSGGPIVFTRLCAAAREVERLQSIIPGVTALSEEAATEEAVKELRGPRILHLNAHGYAFQVSDIPMTKSESCLGERVDSPYTPCAQWNVAEWRAIIADPLVRAGVALAGINLRRSPGGYEDGRLSAAEASLLDLGGTQLVVVSACESGLGEAAVGEGVAGFRRAFALAGSRAQTFSLWKVRDQDAADFMEQYYRLLMSGTGNAEALAIVKRDLISKNVDPMLWAVFVSYGYAGSLGR